MSASRKSRIKKKEWVSRLESQVEYLAHDNESLSQQVLLLKQELMDVKLKAYQSMT